MHGRALFNAAMRFRKRRLMAHSPILLRKIAVVPLSYALLILAACGNAPESSEAVPDSLFTAVESLLSPPGEVMQARRIIEAECLRAHGLNAPISYEVSVYPRQVADVGGVFRSKEDALTKGYPSTTSVDSSQDELSTFEQSLSTSQKKKYERLTDFTGKYKDSSCVAESDRVIFGSSEKTAEVLNTYNDYGTNKTKSTLEDQDVQNALTKKYFPCLAASGFDVKKIGQMGEIAQSKLGHYRKATEAPGEAERNIALTDYKCQQKAALLHVFQTALKRTAGKWMVENEALLLDRYERLQDAVKKSNKVIKGELTYGNSVKSRER